MIRYRLGEASRSRRQLEDAIAADAAAEILQRRSASSQGSSGLQRPQTAPAFPSVSQTGCYYFSTALSPVRVDRHQHHHQQQQAVPEADLDAQQPQQRASTAPLGASRTATGLPNVATSMTQNADESQQTRPPSRTDYFMERLGRRPLIGKPTRHQQAEQQEEEEQQRSKPKIIRIDDIVRRKQDWSGGLSRDQVQEKRRHAAELLAEEERRNVISIETSNQPPAKLHLQSMQLELTKYTTEDKIGELQARTKHVRAESAKLRAAAEKAGLALSEKNEVSNGDESLRSSERDGAAAVGKRTHNNFTAAKHEHGAHEMRNVNNALDEALNKERDKFGPPRVTARMIDERRRKQKREQQLFQNRNRFWGTRFVARFPSCWEQEENAAASGEAATTPPDTDTRTAVTNAALVPAATIVERKEGDGVLEKVVSRSCAHAEAQKETRRSEAQQNATLEEILRMRTAALFRCEEEEEVAARASIVSTEALLRRVTEELRRNCLVREPRQRHLITVEWRRGIQGILGAHASARDKLVSFLVAPDIDRFVEFEAKRSNTQREAFTKTQEEGRRQLAIVSEQHKEKQREVQWRQRWKRDIESRNELLFIQKEKQRYKTQRRQLTGDARSPSLSRNDIERTSIKLRLEFIEDHLHVLGVREAELKEYLGLPSSPNAATRRRDVGKDEEQNEEGV